jgi:hypothetical protein
MLTWAEFRETRPDLADAGQSLFYQFGGVGLGFLGTVRVDGGPRVHPMCPVIMDDGIYAMLVPSPKLQDLLRDGRYAMHSFPCVDNEDAFYINRPGRSPRRRRGARQGRTPVPRGAELGHAASRVRGARSRRVPNRAMHVDAHHRPR